MSDETHVLLGGSENNFFACCVFCTGEWMSGRGRRGGLHSFKRTLGERGETRWTVLWCHLWEAGGEGIDVWCGILESSRITNGMNGCGPRIYHRHGFFCCADIDRKT